MLILEMHTGDLVHLFGVFFFFSFFGGDKNTFIEKLISEVMELIECYSQPVRNLVCRLSELFE